MKPVLMLTCQTGQSSCKDAPVKQVREDKRKRRRQRRKQGSCAQGSCWAWQTAGAAR